MDVILLERVENLGHMGDVVKVRAGYARNFLLPQKKALRANEANRQAFEAQRAELETRNAARRELAETSAHKLDGQSFVIIRQASEAGLLFGSVSARDIAEAASASGVKVERNEVRLNKPIKSLGLHKVRIALHPEVPTNIEINVARSPDEAERQARGENVLGRRDETPDADETVAAEFFDETTGEAVDKETE